MTEETGALSCLLEIGAGAEALARFHARWQGDANVMDKWFMLQIALAAPDRAVEVARELTAHPLFSWKNPNRFRSVIGAMSANHAGFHRADGVGYAFVADWLLTLDPVNPQTAARMSTAFETWRRYDADRQGMVQDQLRRILATPGLSRDMAEMAGRMLG
jgi:aminopeptidase N